jgi:hypothetical protein
VVANVVAAAVAVGHQWAEASKRFFRAAHLEGKCF